ncbi:MAG: crotonase/enoyl-CoA hydratase family protein [Pseudomonadota bacterium]|nr:crotonase/enoyl-CoA hydratase family protein [Pseudomonadota bacterium]
MSVISSQQQDRVQIIQWDDGKANAVSQPLLEELHGALDQAQQDKKAVVLVGRPGRFSAGFDLNVMGQGGDAMARLVVGGAKLASRLLAFPMPVVVACSGHALAMGGLLLLSADHRVGVSGEFKIGLNEVAIGLTMPWFGVELARGRLHPAHFNRAVNNAEMYTPDTSVAAGFLDQVVAAENLLNTAVVKAEALMQLNLEAHHGTKLRVREDLLGALQTAISKDFGAAALEW